jgi:sarcosine oxidase/L-pipecolate oxidase
MCLISSIFPAHLKHTEIEPLFKNGDRNNMSNYRPIAPLTSFSKILEMVMYERLCQHINNNNIISEEQYGLQGNSPTDKASHKLINDTL